MDNLTYKLLTNFSNKKEPVLKKEFHTKYKKYRNLLSTLLKKRSLISLKTVASHVPTVLSLDNGDTITNPYDIVNTFNNCFASIAETTKKSIKHSLKYCPDYLSNETSSTNLICLNLICLIPISMYP